MNDGFPPLELPMPERRTRRSEKPRPVPLPAELLARRAEIAQILGAKVSELSRRLRALSADERRAVFYKLEHDRPIKLDGTGLKVVSEPASDVTLAVPREDTLEGLLAKLDELGKGAIRAGMAPNQSLVYLREIAEADPTERLSPELRENYIELQKQSHVILEIELRSMLQGKKQQLTEIRQFLLELRTAFAAGVHGTLFEHEIALPTCRAVIRCTGKFLTSLVEDPRWIACIRWFEARPKFQTFSTTLEQFKFDELEPIQPPDDDAAVVCVVDTGISIGNPFLSPVTRQELVHSYLESKPDNPSDEYGHGSAVASLVSYYALNLAPGSLNAGKVWVAGARILNERNELEDGRLFSSLLREVVADFSKLGVRIFCLAIGDEAKRWNETSKQDLSRKSWVARTIDQLSYEHDVVFVTCTGNITISELQEMLAAADDYPSHFVGDEARILDPGQAALALTAGSVARGTQIIASASTPIAMPHQPSPFTRCGPGIRGDTKPEVVEYGGNLAFDGSLNRVIENQGLKVVTASHQITPAITLSCGTSFAAPRVAHRLAVVQTDLESLGLESPSAPLLKAFVVNSAMHQEVIDARTAFDEIDSDLWLNVAGYGVPDDIRATYGDEYSIVLYYDGEITPDEVLFFDVPIPKELVDARAAKRLTVTVAHYPEVQRWGLERYLAVDLKWRLFRGNVNRDEIVEAMSAEVMQSDEEIPPSSEDEEDIDMPSEVRCVHGINRRSRGTVQHDCHEWKLHKAEYSDSHYTLAVAAYKRWQRKVAPFALAIVVRLEDLGRSVPIYSRVQTLIEAEVEIRNRG